MSVIETEPVPEVGLSAESLRWYGFVRELMPWQFHWLMKSGRECELHDEYISGTKSLKTIYAVIIRETEHMEPKGMVAETQKKA